MVGRKKKPHGLRPVDHDVDKIHVRADCDNCYKWETVSMYQDEIEHREFNTHFFECEQCGHVICSVCYPDKKDLTCPVCTGGRVVKVRPFDIYLCSVCLQEWHNDRLCSVCRYDRRAEL
ncbi:MAG: hypothetical protein ABIH11_07580 [Candidatus Altiarchaeota archaeon]